MYNIKPNIKNCNTRMYGTGGGGDYTVIYRYLYTYYIRAVEEWVVAG